MLRARNLIATAAIALVLLAPAWLISRPAPGPAPGSAATVQRAEEDGAGPRSNELSQPALSPWIGGAAEPPEASQPKRRTAHTFAGFHRRFVRAVAERHAINAADVSAGYGVLVERALASSDALDAMKAAMVLHECRQVPERLDLAFETLHRGGDAAHLARLEQAQALQRRCQSLTSVHRQALPALLRTALAAEEPLAAALLSNHHSRSNTVPDEGTRQQIVRGLARDAADGDNTSLNTLALAGSRLGLDAETQVAYEMAWRVVSGATSGMNLSNEEFMERLLKFSDPSTSEAEKADFASTLSSTLLALDRPQLSPEQAERARHLAMQFLNRLVVAGSIGTSQPHR